MSNENDSPREKFDTKKYLESYRSVLYRKLFLHALGMNPNSNELQAFSLSGILKNLRNSTSTTSFESKPHNNKPNP